MKGTLFFVICILSMGCKKNDNNAVDPDFSSIASGTYSITTVVNGSDTTAYPYGGISGSVYSTKIDQTHIHLGYRFIYPSSGPYYQEIGDAELRNDIEEKNGFSIYINNKKTGSISSNSLSIVYLNQNNSLFKIIGKKP